MSPSDASPTAVTPDSGWIARSDRVRIEIAGPDRAKFLHNLVTNEVKKLAEGRGSEAFITTPQGKTLAYVTLNASETSIFLRSDVGEADGILGHLRKYGVFDDVAIDDVTGRTFELHAFGRCAGMAERMVNTAGLADAPLAHVQSEWNGHPIRLIRESPTGRPGVTIIGPREAEAAAREHLARDGFGEEIAPAVFEAMRIEAGTPVSGREVTPSNLPQEVGRDSATISFVKGCYLGQETVARLDALGHVNKILKGLQIEGIRAPTPGASLTAADGKAAGTVTSAAFSPGLGAPVALAYVRVAYANAGTLLTVEVGGEAKVAVVANLPMIPDAAR